MGHPSNKFEIKAERRRRDHYGRWGRAVYATHRYNVWQDHLQQIDDGKDSVR